MNTRDKFRELQEDKESYNGIESQEDFNRVLASGMFWELYPELTGDWSKDRIKILGESSEERMNVIAQNGNSGLHYNLSVDNFDVVYEEVLDTEAKDEEDRRGVVDDYEPTKAELRKATPVFSGVLKYFPNALKEVAKCSQAGNDQHHPDKPLHWDMDKSKDEYDALTRHLIDHTINPIDDDGTLHLAKVAWRALAGLERHLTNKL